MATLDLSSFGSVVLRIVTKALRSRSRGLLLAGDVLLYVGKQSEREQQAYGPYQFDQSAIDWYLANDPSKIHAIIGEASQQLLFDRWMETKRTVAVSIGQAIDLVCEPIRELQTEDAAKLANYLRIAIGEQFCQAVESGYSMRQACAQLGINYETLRKRIQRLRAELAS